MDNKSPKDENFCDFRDFCVTLKSPKDEKSVKSVESVWQKRKEVIMKKQRIIELAMKVLVAALTAFLTAIGTTSCMGHGPIVFWTVTC